MSKKIAIIGGGFVGLASAEALSIKNQVTLIEKKEIGSGASGASAGLLHPYAGQKGRKSWEADSAMQATLELLARAESILGHPVASFSGIIKEGLCVGAGEDVEQLSPNRFLIRSGVTVFVDRYLQALYLLCLSQGVSFEKRRISCLEELKEYDEIVLAVGAGIAEFPESKKLNINFVKGQALRCSLEKPLERSVTHKSYIALSSCSTICYIGSTYERAFNSEEPCLETAVKLLNPLLPVLEVRAGIRVTNRAHYFPLLEKLNEKTWAITAMGSRGLLYHAYFAKRLAALLYPFQFNGTQKDLS